MKTASEGFGGSGFGKEDDLRESGFRVRVRGEFEFEVS